MAKIVEYRDVSLDDLVIDQGQVRTDPGVGIEELAKSIEVQGLLQPIVICPARDPQKWEILAGQRRFLAHKQLKKTTISAAILDERVSKGEAKAISITENLIRRKLSSTERKDGILYLYKLYGSIKDVSEKTGIPANEVRNNVNYPRLIDDLKEMVDSHKVDVNVAVKAQDAATGDDGVVDPKTALTLAKEMQPMTGAQRGKFAKTIKEKPNQPIDEVIEDAKTGSNVIQVVTTITKDTHAAIQQFVNEENITQDEATGILIEDSLIDKGFLER